MTTEERQRFWEIVESGDNPLLSVMSGLVEKWGMPAIVMALGDIANVLSEDAVDADNLNTQSAWTYYELLRTSIAPKRYDAQ